MIMKVIKSGKPQVLHSTFGIAKICFYIIVFRFRSANIDIGVALTIAMLGQIILNNAMFQEDKFLLATQYISQLLKIGHFGEISTP